MRLHTPWFRGCRAPGEQVLVAERPVREGPGPDAAAQRLIGGLGGEKTRWQATVEALTVEEANLIGDVCVAAGAVAYLGPFIAAYRTACEVRVRVRVRI